MENICLTVTCKHDDSQDGPFDIYLFEIQNKGLIFTFETSSAKFSEETCNMIIKAMEGNVGGFYINLDDSRTGSGSLLCVDGKTTFETVCDGYNSTSTSKFTIPNVICVDAFKKLLENIKSRIIIS